MGNDRRSVPWRSADLPKSENFFVEFVPINWHTQDTSEHFFALARTSLRRVALMSLPYHWRSWLAARTLASSGSRQKKSRPARRPQLTLQPLEDRRLLAFQPVGAEFRV